MTLSGGDHRLTLRQFGALAREGRVQRSFAGLFTVGIAVALAAGNSEMPDNLLAGLAIVSTDRETLDGVKDYFERAGARVRTTSRLDEAADDTADADAVVFFADDYPAEAGASFLSGLAARLVIVVTANLPEFNASRANWRRTRPVVVLSRPAWGWVLLDAVRAGLDDRSGRT